MCSWRIIVLKISVVKERLRIRETKFVVVVHFSCRLMVNATRKGEINDGSSFSLPYIDWVLVEHVFSIFFHLDVVSEDV